MSEENENYIPKRRMMVLGFSEKPIHKRTYVDGKYSPEKII